MNDPLEPSQTKQIFHTQCKIRGKVCELIIDGKICTNAASMALIYKLRLPTKMHLDPYTLQHLKQGNEVTISKQALIHFQLVHIMVKSYGIFSVSILIIYYLVGHSCTIIM